MQVRKNLSICLLVCAGAANAGQAVFVLNGSNEFGTVDLTTGAFTQIGAATAEGTQGLAPGPKGSLLTLGFNGDLYSLDTSNGVLTDLGATGLDDCSSPASHCGLNSGSVLGNLGSSVYALDFANRLYSISPATAKATVVGLTGMPALPFLPLSNNPDGTFNAYDETLFSAGGNLYATYDAFTVDPANNFALGPPLIAPELYRINPFTGKASVVGSIPIGLGGVAVVNGSAYALDNANGEILTLNLLNGSTSFAGNFDPSAGIIDTAFAAAPEPASFVLSGIGIAAILLRKKIARRVRSQKAA